MNISPLTKVTGMEINGVALAEPIRDEIYAAIRQALFHHGVILFRAQRLSEEQQVAFASRFGELGKVLHRHKGASKHHEGVMFVSNIRENGELIGALPDGEMMFHSDQCYIEVPSAATMLYAMEVPSKGGDTLFANMVRAFETLPAELKRVIEGRRAVHSYVYRYERLRVLSTWRPPLSQAQIDAVPPVDHPVVRLELLRVERAADLLEEHVRPRLLHLVEDAAC